MITGMNTMEGSESFSWLVVTPDVDVMNSIVGTLKWRVFSVLRIKYNEMIFAPWPSIEYSTLGQ